MQDKIQRWALKWHSENITDGITEHIIFSQCQPKFFTTREDARIYANMNYGYIKKRKDLRAEPHGWRFPRAIKVSISIQEINPITIK